MVLHAGIVCYDKTKKGKLVIYNTETKERTTKDVMTVGPGDNNGVDELFGSIQSYFTAQKGCLCICLGNFYDSEIRRKFIDAGKGFGFKKVGITDWLSADYSDLVSSTDLFGKIETLKGFILIFCGKTCRVWRKDNDRARFVKDYRYEDTVESLHRIKNMHNAYKNSLNIPLNNAEKYSSDLVIYGDKLKPAYQKAEEIFGKDNVVVYSELNQERGVLVKARIMGNDNEMKKYATETLLEQNVVLKIGGVPLTTVQMFKGLPFNFQAEVTKPDGATELEMHSYSRTNKKCLPEAKKLIVKFNIDVNGICNVDIENSEEAAADSGLEKKKGKKYSSNNSLPTTDTKPKFQPRAPGQAPRPRGNPPQQQNPQPGQQPGQQPRVRTNIVRGQSYSTSSLASTDSTNSRGGGRGGGGRGGGGGNRGGRGGNRGGGNHANFQQQNDAIPGAPPQLQQHGYNPGFGVAPQMVPNMHPQSNPMSPNPYGMHQQQFQQSYPQVYPGYPTSPQYPPQGYPNGMPAGYQPAYNPPFNPSMPNQFQHMGGFPTPPPPPYAEASNNFSGGNSTPDYKKPAFDPTTNQSGDHGNGKEKGNKKGGKR